VDAGPPPFFFAAVSLRPAAKNDVPVWRLYLPRLLYAAIGILMGAT
jgi:hypothetical protein